MLRLAFSGLLTHDAIGSPPQEFEVITDSRMAGCLFVREDLPVQGMSDGWMP